MAERAQNNSQLALFSCGVFSETPIVDIKPKERIYKIGEPATHIAFIRKGLAFVGFSKGGRDYLAEIVKGPILIGEDALLNDPGRPSFRTSFARAISPCEVQFISPDGMRDLITTDPDTYMEFVQQTARRQRRIIAKLARSRNGAQSQIGAAMMDFWDAKQDVREGVTFTQQDLGDYEGVTRPTTVKIVQDITKKGIGTLKSTIDTTALTAYIAENRRVVSRPQKDGREVPDLETFDMDRFDVEALLALTQAQGILIPEEIRKNASPKREERNAELLANLGMVFKVARQFKARGILDGDDHFQEGVLGFIRMIDRGEVDEEKGGIASLGWKYIRGSILTSLRNGSRTIRVPSHIYDHHSKVTEAWGRKAQAVQGQPQIADVAADVDATIENIEYTLTALELKTLPLTIESNDDSDYEIDAADRDPSTEDVVIAKELSERIDGLLKSDLFSKAEALIIRARHLRDRPVSTDRLAEALGITRTAIDAIENRALTKFRSADFREELMDYYR